MSAGVPRPVLVYDGDCGFCRRWVARWRKVTGDAVEYLPSDAAIARFPAVPAERYLESVQLIGGRGLVLSGAAAVFAALDSAGRTWPLWCYRRVPGFAVVAEAVYRLVARHRRHVAALDRRLLPERPGARSGASLGRLLLLAGLALLRRGW